MADPAKKRKILLVVSSHEEKDNGEKTGFFYQDLAEPYAFFADANFDVTIASIKGGNPPIEPKSFEDPFFSDTTKAFDKDPVSKEKLANSKKLSEVNLDEFEAMYVCGGHGTLWDYNDPALSKAVEKFEKDKKPFAANCHGPLALAWAKKETGEPFVKGRSLTCFPDQGERDLGFDKGIPFFMEERLREAGAKLSNKSPLEANVVRDGTMLTGQNPASTAPLVQALFDMVNGK